MTLLLPLLVFAALVLVGYALSALALTRQQDQQALTNRLTTMAGTTNAGVSGPLLKDTRLSQIPLLDAILGNTPFVAPLVQMIEQAGLRRRVGEVLLYVLLVFLIVMILVVLFVSSPQFQGAFFGAVMHILDFLGVDRTALNAGYAGMFPWKK